MQLWSVKFSLEAIDELQQAINYYNFQKTSLGIEFMIEFENQIQRLSSNPFTHSVRYLSVRMALVNRFPYAIHYVIEETEHTIIIQTVLSTFKDPYTNWKAR